MILYPRGFSVLYPYAVSPVLCYRVSAASLWNRLSEAAISAMYGKLKGLVFRSAGQPEHLITWQFYWAVCHDLSYSSLNGIYR